MHHPNTHTHKQYMEQRRQQLRNAVAILVQAHVHVPPWMKRANADVGMTAPWRNVWRFKASWNWSTSDGSWDWGGWWWYNGGSPWSEHVSWWYSCGGWLESNKRCPECGASDWQSGEFTKPMPMQEFGL